MWSCVLLVLLIALYLVGECAALRIQYHNNINVIIKREKKWSKCPICNESIYRKDIKRWVIAGILLLFVHNIMFCSVTALSSPQFEVGDTISMKLMVRKKV
jgi:hypothetical protein